MKRENAEKALQPYIDAELGLIPLHAWNALDGKGNNLGKVPTQKWLTRSFTPEAMINHMAAGSNVGAKLDATWVVIDVDPRNYDSGVNSFEQLRKDLELKECDYPIVATGSEGLHIYMRKPADVSVIDSHPDYPGVEFKTYGRFMVAAGSTHPNGKPYKWDMFGATPLAGAKQAPVGLLGVIKREVNTIEHGDGGAGRYTQEELADMLAGLDPHDFGSNEKWLPLMMACHYATGGAGRHEFLQWCLQDSRYANESASILSRWDSLTRSGQQGNKIVTHKTLFKHLSNVGKLNLVPVLPDETVENFPSMSAEELSKLADGKGSETLSPLEEVNREFALVFTDKGLRAVRFPIKRNEDGRIPGSEAWQYYKIADFKSWAASFPKVVSATPTGRPKPRPLADVWLEWPLRRQYDRIVFNPSSNVSKDELNLWTGWGVEPSKKGSWELLDQMLFKSLCAGDEAVYEYVLNWTALMVQKPDQAGQVAIAFRGEKGLGKGTWGETLLKIAGRHGLVVTTPEALTGRFNGHLRDKIFIFADEAISPYDLKAQSTLKALITESYVSYESKGADITQDKNRLHIMLASNYDVIVPAGMDGERRFLVQNATDDWKREGGDFGELKRQLKAGGYEAFLFDMLNRDISKFDVRKIPNTEALVEQKMLNLKPIEQWWLTLLEAGELPFVEESGDWKKEDVRVFREDVLNSYESFCRSRQISPYANGRGSTNSFTRQLRTMAPGAILYKTTSVPPSDRPDLPVRKNGRTDVSFLPSLAVCRDAFEKRVGRQMQWQEQDLDE